MKFQFLTAEKAMYFDEVQQKLDVIYARHNQLYRLIKENAPASAIQDCRDSLLIAIEAYHSVI